MKEKVLLEIHNSFWMCCTSSFLEYGFEIDIKALKESPMMVKESGFKEEAIFSASKMAYVSAVKILVLGGSENL
jgi:hypothetical protein